MRPQRHALSCVAQFLPQNSLFTTEGAEERGGIQGFKRALKKRAAGTARATTVEANEVSGQVVDAAMKVHSALGPGLLESAYEACLAHELRKRGLQVQSQVVLPVIYDGVAIELGYRIDLLVEDVVIVELKVVEQLAPIHQAQLLSYLKLSKRQVGLLINFHVNHLRDGIKRMVNNV
jgi:GxxExxY protein